MTSETILDIILGSVLGLAHLLSAIYIIFWRRKKYSKGIHTTHIGATMLCFSVCMGVVLPIGGFTYPDGGQSGTKALITAMVICPFPLVASLRFLCFCVFIDEKSVIERVLWFEKRIRLDEPGTLILLDNSYGRLVISIISEDKKKMIEINERHFLGDVSDFLEACKKIRKENL